jgi:hypothetical protein
MDPREAGVAKPNYSFEKRQRELAKKKKKEEKSRRKLGKGSVSADASPASSPPVPATVDTGKSSGNT